MEGRSQNGLEEVEVLDVNTEWYKSKRAVEHENTDTSALAEHAWKEDHRVDWEEVEVLDVNTEWYKRCVVESWHIQREPTTMNRD